MIVMSDHTYPWTPAQHSYQAAASLLPHAHSLQPMIVVSDHMVSDHTHHYSWTLAQHPYQAAASLLPRGRSQPQDVCPYFHHYFVDSNQHYSMCLCRI